jgi:hypothetical protein
MALSSRCPEEFIKGEKAVDDAFLSVVHPKPELKRNGEAKLLFEGSTIIFIVKES